MNEILKTIKSRRSVRAYTEQQISQEDLTAILEAATYAPSGMGLQTWQLNRSEEHTSELQSRLHLVCRLLLEKRRRAKQNRTETSAKKRSRKRPSQAWR